MGGLGGGDWLLNACNQIGVHLREFLLPLVLYVYVETTFSAVTENLRRHGLVCHAVLGHQGS